ncbi:MAG: DUF2442 domain-containing protein [Bacteroidota bacterium]
MIRPVEVRALPKYKIWIKYSDGNQGEVDLSEFVGRGVFKLWEDYSFFQKISLGSSGEIMWNDQIDFCPDSIYMKLTGKTVVQLFPQLSVEVDA